MGKFYEMLAGARQRLALPVAVYPGIQETGATVEMVVTDARAQSAAALAIHRRFKTPALLAAMDLSVEAEAFGCPVQISRDEIPTTVGNVAGDRAQAEALPVPLPGDRRTRVQIETVRLLAATGAAPVLAGCIGPFSLAGRLAGLSEACSLTLSDPEHMRLLLRKSTAFLIAYLRALKEAGAAGVIMAEPAAGLLSPRGMAAFSSAYVREIIQAVEDANFDLVLHNCGAKAVHLPSLWEAGARLYHFGAAMDLMAALGKAPASVIVCGNLDPAAIFLQAAPAQVAEATRALLAAARPWRNFVISSGCDVPPPSPLANLEAFFSTVSAEQNC